RRQNDYDARSLAHKCLDRSTDFIDGAYIDRRYPHCQASGRRLDLAPLHRICWSRDIDESAHLLHTRHKVESNFHQLPGQAFYPEENSSHIAPGCASLAAKPKPTGSVILTPTIGMLAVVCFAARTPGVVAVTIKSGLSLTNSSANNGMRDASPSA